MRLNSRNWLLTVAAAVALAPAAPADQQILDDLIVHGSACVGQDCVNGEAFGFDTIRLKENNLRIRFFDTSSTASFPSRDWQLTANDSSNGGANKFSIDDIDGGRTPFTVEASSPSHSVYINDNGKIGFRTSTPVADLHVKQGNTPTLRLEQDGSSGFTPQTWDVAGNEANFFVRDATNSSTLPFKIFPGAPNDALTVEGSTGDVGVGTKTPSAPVHVKRATGASATMLRLENNSAANVQLVRNADIWAINHSNSGAFIWDSQIGGAADGPEATLDTDGDFTLSDNGGVFLELKDAAAGNSWFNSHTNAGNYVIDSQVGGAADGAEFTLDVNGNLTTQGTVNGSSSRERKHDIFPVDPNGVLAAVNRLEINTWKYNHDTTGSRHIGPMAEDFYAAFEVGIDNKHISSTDTAGVALASIQALSKQNSKLEADNEELKAKNSELQARLEKIEKLLSIR